MSRALSLLTIANTRGARIEDVHSAAQALAAETGEITNHARWVARQNLPSIFLKESLAEEARMRAEGILADCAEMGITVLLYGSPDYPAALYALPDAPPVLYVRGSVAALQHPRPIAVVGTRKPTALGIEFARWVGRTLAEQNICVVSGLALGSDALAHQGTLDHGGITVAVLAHGLDMVSPARHRELANAILDEGGTLVAEYPPHTRAYPGNFVQRNRIQIGLARGLLVVETSVDGGTMHTVSFARDQRKPIACLDPGAEPVDDEQRQGNRLLLEKQWAVPVSDKQSVVHFVTTALELK
jgi:DNA processing protein